MGIYLHVDTADRATHWIKLFGQKWITKNKKNNIYIIELDTENIKLVFCAVKDTIMQTALKEFNLA